MRAHWLIASILLLPACQEDRPAASATGSNKAAAEPYAPSAANGSTRKLFDLQITPPPSWKYVGRQEGMIASEKFTLPKAEGDSEDGELKWYQGAMGDREANIQRWFDQIEQPGGGDSSKVGKRSEFKVGALSITFIDVSGHYNAPAMMPGAAAAGKKTGYRLLAAYIEGGKGPWYVKAIGPEKTMAQARDGFEQMLKNLVAE